MPEDDIDKEAQEVYNQLISEVGLEIDRQIPSPPTGPIQSNKIVKEQNAPASPTQSNESKKDIAKNDYSSPVGFSKKKLSDKLGQIDANREKLRKSGINQLPNLEAKEAIDAIRTALDNSTKDDLRVDLSKRLCFTRNKRR